MMVVVVGCSNDGTAGDARVVLLTWWALVVTYGGNDAGGAFTWRWPDAGADVLGFALSRWCARRRAGIPSCVAYSRIAPQIPYGDDASVDHVWVLGRQMALK
jgi:hypothetical protein